MEPRRYLLLLTNKELAFSRGAADFKGWDLSKIQYEESEEKNTRGVQVGRISELIRLKTTKSDMIRNIKQKSNSF